MSTMPDTPCRTTPAVAARRRPPSRRRGLAVPLALAASLAAVGEAVRAQPASPEDWPCVQVYVPALSPASFWPLPIPEALASGWRDDEDVRALATRLGELERVDEAALAAIEAFAAAVPESEREDALTRLAVGTLAVADERRSDYLDGIRRYTRQQIAIAGQIESTLNRLAELDDAAAGGDAGATSAGTDAGGTLVEGGADDIDRAAVEETLAWHERLYDQRERAIRALCERPVALEETLSEVLRELSYRLPEA